ncbi:MAG: DUF721 domain-containing protein [Verrucomicrobiota bacterium]|nr:DUF721 domain-containing protein [Verrucomicrobiota bacterium]
MQRGRYRKNYHAGEAKAKVLASWRGIDMRPLETAAADTVRPIKEVMPGLLKEIGLERRQSDLEILKVWNNSLDPVITQHAQPVNLVKGTLFVKVDSSVWLHEILRYRNKEILQRLKHSFGPDLISRISYRA